MRYLYAIINDYGKCYEVRRCTDCVCDPHYVPIKEISAKYLSKYYHPVPNVVDNDADFLGKWYKDFNHTIEEVAL